MNIGNLSINTSQNKMDKYIQHTDTGNIYKVMPTHLLQLSPWNDGDDRRVYEVEDGKYHVITYQNACMIVNKQFNDTTEEWKFGDKEYIARKQNDAYSVDEHAAILAMLPNHKVMKASEDVLRQLDNGQTLSISAKDGMSELKLVRHKGKIYYMLIVNEVMPRVKLLDLFGKFCTWAHIKNVKPIYCKTDKRYI